MKRSVCFFISFLLIYTSAAAQSNCIDIKELQTQSGFSPSMIKGFTGVYSEPTNTASEIRAIGQRLGTEIHSGKSYANDYLPEKYTVQRFEETALGAGADMFYVGVNAKVDTLKNLVRILAGYVEKVYNVSPKEADEIAYQICLYNAANYDKFTFLKEKYTPEIFDAFNKNSIGLPADYRNWSGNIKLIVPHCGAYQFKSVAIIEPPAPPVPQEEQYPSVENVTPERTPLPDSTSVTEPERAGLPVVLIVLFGILAAIILAVAIYLIVRHFKSKEDSDMSSTDSKRNM